MSKTCVECSNWSFDAGCTDYSDLTPGEEWRMICSKQHFYIGGYNVTEEELRNTLLKAEECTDYASRNKN